MVEVWKDVPIEPKPPSQNQGGGERKMDWIVRRLWPHQIEMEQSVCNDGSVTLRSRCSFIKQEGVRQAKFGQQ